MATKTFKIGLSNTDKQNMAQDVYERLLALTFPEYDTETSYEVGDFVVYNDQLYKCIGSTSGAWDSTKWQLATLNDLLTDIEDAVAFVNDKANVDGNYPTMTVGVADQLSPYDDESGDDQDEPFSFQATGTGNGTQPDFATGAIALMKEKQGNSVVVNQWLANGNFTSDDGWTASSGVTFSVANNKCTVVSSTENNGVKHAIANKPVVGHKILLRLGCSSSDVSNIRLYVSGSSLYIFSGVTSTYTVNYIIFDVPNVNFGVTTLEIAPTGATGTYVIGDILFIDLTQWFNGDIPQDLLDNPSNFFHYYQGSLAYNTGELVNANGRYIKCIGMNQWDEEWEVGVYNTLTGEKAAGSGDRIRCKNLIKVIPNATYYFKSPYNPVVLCYDKNGTFIPTSEYSWQYAPNMNANSTFTVPKNCCFITFFVNSSAYGTTYNHDISINLYYEDEPRCLTYEPYEVLTNNDTGTETLRSAGSVRDSKKPDGTIHRLVGVVDLGSLNWTIENGCFVSDGIGETIKYQTSNLTCAKYVAHAPTYRSDLPDKQVMNTINRYQLAIKDSSYQDAATFKTAMSGVYLFYELAEPTTEQGTPYSENLVIDDFGSMDFQGTNGVPQGNLIFYPVDYKAFIDTLYDYIEGTPSELVKQSERTSDKSAQATLDTALQNAIGGTLRHCLAIQESDLNFEDTDFVDLGTLDWTRVTDNVESPYFRSNSNLSYKYDATQKNFITTKYSLKSVGSSGSDNGIFLTNVGQVRIRDTAYTDATAFKNAMKGVLLAYEKASS